MFNRQFEPSKEGLYDYKPDAWKKITKMIGVGSGVTYLWAIRPTHNNGQHEAYGKGITPE